MLPAPDSISAISSSHEDEEDSNSEGLEYQTGRRFDTVTTDGFDSNSTDAVAARYADNPVQRTHNVSAKNEGDTTAAATKIPSLYDSNDIALPVTMAPGTPDIGQQPRLVTSISTSGSVGGAMAVGIDAEYLAVTVDQQKSAVSRHRSVL